MTTTHLVLTGDLSGQLVLLLLSGHLLAEFGWPALAVRTWPASRGAAARRLALGLLVRAAVLLPLLGPWTLAAATLLGLLHPLLTARAAGAATARPPRALGPLLRLQLLGLALVAAAWWLLASRTLPVWSVAASLAVDRSSATFLPGAWPTIAWPALAAAAGIVAAVLRGGVVLTAAVLDRFPGLPFEAQTVRMGRTIGMLERALVLLLVVLDQWGAVGLVVAAKSLARFEDLKRRHFAEYYLIGTLTSLLVACVGGLILRALLQT